jgi:hypothetical protein
VIIAVRNSIVELIDVGMVTRSAAISKTSFQKEINRMDRIGSIKGGIRSANSCTDPDYPVHPVKISRATNTLCRLKMTI